MTKKYNCRIETTFNNLRDKNKPALITFITAGDPNISATKSILEKLPKAGADLIIKSMDNLGNEILSLFINQ